MGLSYFGPCFYCGVPSNTPDHVWPRSQGGRKTVPCCKECNVLLSAKTFSTIEDRVGYLKCRLATRYRKALATPDWTDEELGELGYNLRRKLRGRLILRGYIRERLAHIPSYELYDGA